MPTGHFQKTCRGSLEGAIGLQKYHEKENGTKAKHWVLFRTSSLAHLAEKCN